MSLPVQTPQSAPTQVAWAAKADDNLDRSIFFRFLFFVFVIPLAFALAVWLKYWLIVILFVVSLGLANFFDRITRTLAQYPQIRQAGPVGKALTLAFDLHDFYTNNRPNWFLYYLLYPITAPFGIIFSRTARKEFALYARTFLTLLSALLLELVLSYFSTFPPYLGITEAFGIIIGHVIFTLVFSVICIVPVTTTAFTLSLAKRSRALRNLTIASLLACAFMTTVGMTALKNQTSPVSKGLLGLRMGKSEFRKHLGELLDMSLLYERQQGTYHSQTITDSHTVVLEAGTERMRRAIGRIAINDEPMSFQLVAFRMEPDGIPWLGSYYIRRGDKHYFLSVVNPSGQLIHSWTDLSPSQQQRLAVLAREDGAIVPSMLDNYSSD